MRYDQITKKISRVPPELLDWCLPGGSIHTRSLGLNSLAALVSQSKQLIPFDVPILAGLVVLLALGVFIRLREHRRGRQPIPRQIQKAMRRTAYGWGSTPEQAKRVGVALLIQWLFLGGALAGMSWVDLAVFRTKDRILFVVFTLFLLMGAASVIMHLRQAVALLYYWWRWHRHQQNPLVIVGAVVERWPLAAFADERERELLQIQGDNGMRKVIVVRKEFLDLLLPEAQQRVRLEYCAGTEHVTRLEVAEESG